MALPTASDLGAILSVLTFVGALGWVSLDRRKLKLRAENAEGAATAIQIRLDEAQSELARLRAPALPLPAIAEVDADRLLRNP